MECGRKLGGEQTWRGGGIPVMLLVMSGGGGDSGEWIWVADNSRLGLLLWCVACSGSFSWRGWPAEEANMYWFKGVLQDSYTGFIRRVIF